MKHCRAAHHFAQRALPALAALAALASLSGCAIVSSHAPDTTTPPKGQLYHLPKAVLPIELVAASGALELRMGQPKQIADPAHRYLLTHPVSVFASDNVKVDYDASGLLLAKLTIDSTDQTLNALKEVAKATAIGRTEAAAAGEVLLAEGDFDPDDSGNNAQLMKDLHDALARHVRQWTEQCNTDKSQPERCKLADALQPRLADRTLLQISAKPMALTGNASQTLAEPDCSIGVCYRGQRPHVLRLAVDGMFTRSTVVMLPNNSPAIALPLERAAFVKTEHTVEFQAAGTLKSVETKRPSSALALLSWPLDVYSAVLEATSTLIQLRIGANDKTKELAQSELDTAKELKRIADEMEALRTGNKEAALAGANTRLLSISIGERSPTPASPGNGLLPDGSCKPGQPCPGSDGKKK